MEAYAAESPTSVMTAWNTPLYHCPKGTPEIVDPTGFSDVHSAPWKTTKVTAHGKMQPAKQTATYNPHKFLALKHYKREINREPQI